MRPLLPLSSLPPLASERPETSTVSPTLNCSATFLRSAGLRSTSLKRTSYRPASATCLSMCPFCRLSSLPLSDSRPETMTLSPGPNSGLLRFSSRRCLVSSDSSRTSKRSASGTYFVTTHVWPFSSMPPSDPRPAITATAPGPSGGRSRFFGSRLTAFSGSRHTWSSFASSRYFRTMPPCPPRAGTSTGSPGFTAGSLRFAGFRLTSFSSPKLTPTRPVSATYCVTTPIWPFNFLPLSDSRP
mmetsp:Transcript_91153/g.258135  ORF Transcript_91153/g.258135 Transcript_91153/m.258135 type:complete len:242 (-) Transcript_91153:84-809(-)